MKKLLTIVLLGFSFFACGGKTEESYYETGKVEESPEEFVKWIMSDTLTLSMDVSEKASDAGVDYVESPDKQIRIYRWISGGGTSPCWTTITQYRDSKGKVRCYEGLPIFGVNIDFTITDILVAENIGNQPVYFFDFYAKASSREGYNHLYSAVLQADTFAIGPKFKYNDEILESLDIGYDIPSYYFRTNNGEGWDWMYAYYPEERQIYVPYVNEDMELTNRYMVYEFDGKCFSYIGIKSGRNLHESLHNYDYLVKLFETEQHLVRLDRIKGGCYRLAVWNNPSIARQWHEPDLVISNGLLNSQTERFEFKLNSKVNYEVVDSYSPELWLTNQGRIVSKEKERDHLRSYINGWENIMPELNDSLDVASIKPILLYVTERNVVRVDSMANGTYRYASWKRTAYPYEASVPDLTLESKKKTDEYYVFKNGAYRYEVPLNDMDYFYVYNNTTSICKEMVLKSYTSEEILQLSKKQNYE